MALRVKCIEFINYVFIVIWLSGALQFTVFIFVVSMRAQLSCICSTAPFYSQNKLIIV